MRTKVEREPFSAVRCRIILGFETLAANSRPAPGQGGKAASGDERIRFDGRLIVHRLWIAPLVATALIGGSAASRAGPCAAQIAEVERHISRSAPGPASGPTARQSVRAQLHHQPTPEAVEGAANKARADAEAALARARQADATGDADGCMKALEDAKELYGLE